MRAAAIHARRRRRGGRPRPGRRRPGARPDRRRRHPRAAGPAPHLAAARDVRVRARRASSAIPVQINAYITPPQNRGFAAHYDVHDVFVLQIAGRKTWRIHEPVLDRSARRPAVGTAPRRRCRSGQADAADRHGARTRRRAVPAARLPALGDRARRDVHPPDRRRSPDHALPARPAPARRSRRTTRRCAVRCRWASTSSDPAVLAPQLRETLDALHAPPRRRRRRTRWPRWSAPT